jgi:type IV fimbrial biogenesis protein FimT
MTMIELAIGLSIVAILMAAGMPSFSAWMHNSKIRTTAEAIQSGLQVARAEAVRRNALVRFQLTTSIDAGCAIATSGTNWIISRDDPTGLCANGFIDESFTFSDTTNNPSPGIIKKRTAAEGSSNIIVAAGQASIIFTGAGRVTPALAAPLSIDITNPTGGACATAAGPMRCLRVTVATAGQARMCDPALASTDPRGC